LVEQWIVAPKVAGSSPVIYPMNFVNFFLSYDSIISFFNRLRQGLITNFLIKTYFLFNYYLLNELIWQEGLLIDFLQKKIADNWVKKFLIYSAYLFNERLVFDTIIRFYLDLLIWPLHKIFIFEFNNVSGTLFINLFLFFIFIFIFYFCYMLMLLF
jgi:hypothetical protein